MISLPIGYGATQRMLEAGNRQGHANHQPQAVGAKVFVSYSRKDLEFAQQLVTELIARGFEAFLDKKDILPGEPWQERLGGLIASADTIVFLISPDSIASHHCGWEADEAVRLSKRILPVVYRPVADEDVPGRIKRLNYIFLRNTDDRRAALDSLSASINLDVQWVRDHTRIGEAAILWADRGKGGDDSLLRGHEIVAAERWLSSRPASAPEPTELQRTFIQKSREADTVRINKEKQQVARTRRFQKRASWALIGVGALVLSGIAAAIRQDIETTKREQAIFTSKSLDAVSDERYDTAIRLALQAFPPLGAMPWTPFSETLEARLGEAVQKSRLFLALTGHGAQVTKASFSPDSTRVVTASIDQTAKIWSATTGELQLTLVGHRGGLTAASFSPDGKRVVTSSSDHTARLWDATSGIEIAVLKGHSDALTSAAFSPNGRLVLTTSLDKTAKLWDAHTSRHISTLAGHKAWVMSGAFSPDSRVVVTGAWDQWALVWEVDTERQLYGLQTPISGDVNAVSFSQDGKRILVSAGMLVSVFDANTRKVVSSFRSEKGEFRCATFSPDAETILSCEFGNVVVARPAFLPSEKASSRLYKGHTSEILDATFSLDGKLFVTSSDDSTARVWSTLSPYDIQFHERLRTSYEEASNFNKSGGIRKLLEAFDELQHGSPGLLKDLEGRLSGSLSVRDEILGRRQWSFSPSDLRGAALREHACVEKLIGAQGFTNDELADPVLSTIDKEDPMARNPCLRRGPLSISYYQQLAEHWWWRLRWPEHSLPQ